MSMRVYVSVGATGLSPLHPNTTGDHSTKNPLESEYIYHPLTFLVLKYEGLGRFHHGLQPLALLSPTR